MIDPETTRNPPLLLIDETTFERLLCGHEYSRRGSSAVWLCSS
jgi:hypothetical protein